MAKSRVAVPGVAKAKRDFRVRRRNFRQEPRGGAARLENPDDGAKIFFVASGRHAAICEKL